MSDHIIDLLFRFLHQNSGRLSGRARGKEFAQMTEAEVAAIEPAYLASFSWLFRVFRGSFYPERTTCQ